MKRSIAFLFGLAGVAMLADRMRIRARASAGKKEMVPDYYGNYDIDGVSYDDVHNKVVVSSDQRVKTPTSHSGLSQVECAEKLGDKQAS
jgi:hypothetical protein